MLNKIVVKVVVVKDQWEVQVTEVRGSRKKTETVHTCSLLKTVQFVAKQRYNDYLRMVNFYEKDVEVVLEL